MESAPLEYIWQYNPVTGRVAGANQNYGERINILHSNRYMYNRMQNVQRAQNLIATKKGIQSLSGGSFAHYVPADFKTSEDHDCFIGLGASLATLDSSDQTSSNQLKRLADITLEAEEHKAQQSPHLTASKFLKKFPPVVYEDPFSGSNFAYEFNPFYNPGGNEFSHTISEDGNSGGAISISGVYPKLHGGAISLAGQDPILGRSSSRM